ncbi:hypothetical protein [Parvibaculum sp.]|mgnify:CR=1 FL=1|jgi:hypothetical protein|uniref:hypothetical protein n=1 Tax=Parvibaculum sp. TaxID=2024848 RepID=UPI002FD8BABA
MNRSFDFYEFAGVLVPGAVLLIGLFWIFPHTELPLAGLDFSASDLAIFVFLAYATGHLVQGVGNWIEVFWWEMSSGSPSRKILQGKTLDEFTYSRLLEALRTDGFLDVNSSTVPSSIATTITREVYATVSANGRSNRVDIFNGNYGLLRGLTAALTIIFFLTLFVAKDPAAISISAVLVVLSCQRMNRFSRHYATELFVQYVNLQTRTLGEIAQAPQISAPVGDDGLRN